MPLGGVELIIDYPDYESIIEASVISYNCIDHTNETSLMTARNINYKAENYDRWKIYKNNFAKSKLLY